MRKLITAANTETLQAIRRSILDAYVNLEALQLDLQERTSEKRVCENADGEYIVSEETLYKMQENDGSLDDAMEELDAALSTLDDINSAMIDIYFITTNK